MAFDGVFLSQITKQLDVIINGKINRIHQISDTEILFNIKAKERCQLMISLHSSYNRIHLTNREYPSRNEASNFIMVLRKYLEGGVITSIHQPNYDRYLVINISSRNSLGDKVDYQLYVELMGKYANLILVYQDKIIDALKRIPPFENNKRIIVPSAVFKVTDPQLDKINPDDVEKLDRYDNLFETISGFSPLISNEFYYRINNNVSFQDVFNEVKKSNKMYIYFINDEVYFHCIELKHLNSKPIVMDIFEGLDYLYFTKEEHERIRQITGDLFKFTRREIKKYQQKIDRLNMAMQEALDCDKYRLYGDLLFANQNINTKGVSSVELTDFMGNRVVVPVDGKLDAKANGRKAFVKYKKQTTSINYIQQQLDLTQNNLDYFNMIQSQLETADFASATEIRTELENYGFLTKKKDNRNKSKKSQEPHFQTIFYNDSIIMIGKNNIQNDFITFKKARKEDTWFHCKENHGAHVVINKKDLNEQEIRLCAMLAAYYSPNKDSGSIPVNYTAIKNLKKIPGNKLGKVIMNEYKTIYIDIDLELIKQYIQ